MNSTAGKSIPPEGNDPRALLATCEVEIAPETFSLAALSHTAFAALIQNADISPRGASPFFIFSDKFEVTLLLADQDLRLVRHAMGDARVEPGFRLITFNIVLDFDVVGFMSEVSRLLADAGVPIIAVSAYSRDHILVRQDDLGRALAALGTVNDALC
jgi:uncharacterized protein